MISEASEMYRSHLIDLYRFRDLIANLVMRELRARYRGSALGFFWSFINPLLLMSIYTLVFSVYMKFQMDDYVVYLCSGLLPWLWFSSSLLEGSNAIVAGGNLIKKVLFPAEVLPLVVVLSNLANFIMSLPVLLIFCLALQRFVGPSMFMLPLVIGIQVLLTGGLVLILSAICVRFRDIQHFLANGLTLWFFLTPVIYPLTQIPQAFRFTLLLNPVAPLILAYQDIFYFQRFPDIAQLSVSAAMASLIYLLGCSIFDRHRASFASEV